MGPVGARLGQAGRGLMVAQTAAGRRKEEADSRAKLRACFDEQLTHIRCGDWRGTKGSEVRFIGRVRDLHGRVCTDCPSSPRYIAPST